MAVLFWCIEQIDLKFPRVGEAEKTTHIGASQAGATSFSPETIEMGDPDSGDQFNYPEDASNKQEVVETMIRAEQPLDKFWAAAYHEVSVKR